MNEHNYLDMPMHPMHGTAPPLFVGRDEKTVPFLRSLIEMITNHSHLISFIPGERAHGAVKTPGQIIIHDRDQLQAQVLPLYFNHASFASLRRQLSYFSFIRITKGRQASNVTYINEAVVELSDILRLKRKSVAGGNTSTSPSAAAFSVAAIAAPTSMVQENHSSLRHENKLPRDRPQESSRDVALAVSSGKMHASEANNDLDTKEYPHSSLDVETSKSNSSLSLVSKSGAVTSKIAPRKKNRHRKTHRKIKYSRKTTSRIKKLLYFNKIVPFINLPPPEIRRSDCRDGSDRSLKKISGSDSSGTKKAGSTIGNDSSGDTTPPSMTESAESCYSNVAVAGKDGDANESMVGALLALKGGN